MNVKKTIMRGGALRLYKPDGGQRGRGLGGVLRKAGTNYLKNLIVTKLKRTAKRKGRQLLSSAGRKVSRLLTGQSGGAFYNKRRRRRPRRRRVDIFQY